jgi:hypothetical protein
MKFKSAAPDNVTDESFDPRSLGKRRQREYYTVLAMMGIYCRDKHKDTRAAGEELCAECRELRDYATKRLSLCIFAEKKPTCAKCPVHCYKPDMRVKISAVMRYAGPRMLLAHPVRAIRHLVDGLAPASEIPKRNQA